MEQILLKKKRERLKQHMSWMWCLGKANVHNGVFRENCADVGRLFPAVGSLCRQKDPECDKETSECTDFDGVALCQCKSGYFKYNKMDHSCRGIAFFMVCVLPEFCLIFIVPVEMSMSAHARSSILWINISSSGFFHLVRGLFSRHWRYSLSLGIILSLSGARCESQWSRRGWKGPNCFGLQFSGTEQRWRVALPVLIVSELSANLGEVLEAHKLVLIHHRYF